MKKLSEFLSDEIRERIGYEGMVNPGNPMVIGLEYDSRKVVEGSLYFALTGLHTNGHKFIPDAIRRGARVIVYQEVLPHYLDGAVYIKVGDSRFAMSAIAASFYGEPSKKLACIGVTGTEGKSTTVYLIWQLLMLLGKRAGFISTVRYSVGGDERNNSEHQTTPEAVIIHKRLAEMRENGAEFAVLEASSHGLSERTNRLGDVAFDVGVMTNVTHEHLEFHGTWEQYRFDKANLFRRLAGKPCVPCFGVVNADDRSAGYFASVTDKEVYSYSAVPQGVDQEVRYAASLSLLSIESGAVGNRYKIRVCEKSGVETGEILEVEDNLQGAFNALNVMASLLTVSGILKVPVKDIIGLVPKLRPVRGRMTAVDKGQSFEVLVDYAHTPSSFKTIFPPLRERLNRTGGRIISLFGSAGERDTKKRAEQGDIAAEYSDIVILTDEDPRGEVPMIILEEIAGGISNGKRCDDLFLIPDRPAAIRKAFSLAEKGDLVLLLGKGHENSIIYADETRPYDEITEAERALDEVISKKAPLEGLT
jgi:UDP-N-acetylmuramoyl-L-alanyl-D-glutamate--2,6-diaminopimelate ligase